MAQRRMFSPDIVSSDAFLDMPVSSQVLYFHLAMRADDDGFVTPRMVMRLIGSTEDDLKVLKAKRFILDFESGVIVIKHWLIHNLIRADLYKETLYKKEKSSLGLNENGAYTELREGVSEIKQIESPEWLKRRRGELRTANVPQTAPRSGKVREGQVRLGKDSLTSELSSQVKEIMTLFYEGVNPTINWGNKTTLKACKDLIARFGFEEVKRMTEAVISCQGKPYAPVATTPYQMKEKLAQFKIYFEGKNSKPLVTVI